MMPKKRYQSFFRTPPPPAKIPGSAHDTTIKPTVLDAHAHLCLLASEEEKFVTVKPKNLYREARIQFIGSEREVMSFHANS